jgi:hypothetical protein
MLSVVMQSALMLCFGIKRVNKQYMGYNKKYLIWARCRQHQKV